MWRGSPQSPVEHVLVCTPLLDRSPCRHVVVGLPRRKHIVQQDVCVCVCVSAYTVNRDQHEREDATKL